MRSSEQELRQAIAEADRVLAGAGQSPYPRGMFPELDRRNRRARAGAAAPAFAGTQAAPPAQAEHARPVRPAEDLETALTPENVARWSHELGLGVSARQGRVTRDER